LIGMALDKAANDQRAADSPRRSARAWEIYFLPKADELGWPKRPRDNGLFPNVDYMSRSTLWHRGIHGSR